MHTYSFVNIDSIYKQLYYYIHNKIQFEPFNLIYICYNLSLLV